MLNMTPCGCLTATDANYVPGNLRVKDSNKIYGQVYIVGLRFDYLWVGISRAFDNIEAFLFYLNTTFVALTDKLGTFQYEENFITYSNPEKHLTSEIMAIIGQTLLVFKFGAGGAPLSLGREYDGSFIDGTDTIPGGLLLGKQILSVTKNDDNLELTTDNLLQDPVNKGLTFTSPIYNSNVWVLVADLVPNGVEEGFPFNFSTGITLS